MDIELTSAQPDGTWTWRAAGAKQPRGTLDGALLPEGARVGDVLRAEAEVILDGISVLSVHAPRANSRPEPKRIALLGAERPEGPPVLVTLAGRHPTGRRPPIRRDRPPIRRDRPPAADGLAGAPDSPHGQVGEQRGQTGQPGQPEGGLGSERQAPARGAGRERRRARTSPGDEGRSFAVQQRGRPARPDRRRAEDPLRASRLEAEGGGRAASEGRRRLSPGRAHRQALLDSLPPEQQPIAEQLMRGGIPAVRTALHLEREKAQAEGRPAPNAEALIALAEELQPRVKTAEWRDRAEAAARAPHEIPLRDLRSVVAGSDVARDEQTRELAAQLREVLESRVAQMRLQWESEIESHLDQRHAVKALRLSARPPEPSSRLGSTLASRLSQAASEAMTAETGHDLWMSLLDAAAESPVARLVKPRGIPEDLSPAERASAEERCGRVPALAALLGVPMPPPPLPLASRRAALPKRGGRVRERNQGGRALLAQRAEPAPSGEAPPGAGPADASRSPQDAVLAQELAESRGEG
jgi:hypothetical protein